MRKRLTPMGKLGMRRILVPPGIGDIHWLMLKMQGCIETYFNGEKPWIWVWSENKSTERAAGYIHRLPFVEWGGYFQASAWVKQGQQLFVGGDPYIKRNWNGFDLFWALNAPLGKGVDISKLCSAWKINYDYPVQLDLDDIEIYDAVPSKRPYVMVSFFDHGFYKAWLKHFSIDKIRELLDRLRENHTVVLTGREWDGFMACFYKKGDVNLVGHTSVGQLFALMQRARAFIGFAAGNGMMAQHLNCQTFMLWHPNQWHPSFATNWVDPKRREQGIYHPLSIKAPCITYIMETLDGRDFSTDSPAFGNVVPDRAVQDKP